MIGYLWAAASVLLVSVAQLLMKWAMVQLPPLSSPLLWLQSAALTALPGLALLAGLMAYAASMLCWFAALRLLPLSRVYPLLSLSYVLVWLAALWLPGFHDRFSGLQLLGMAAIVAGLLLICSHRRTGRG
ncbi:4-amino-4-deoxy-L-arabinose-phospho-UDP flippase [Erwinia sp. OLTSP20]|uniref:4-amino-4-deoxy-L-arabinose-phosphoundecaprenol flippase subunit ArnF n=1 Tax=unclassified Erwinia TaxID=2622719 RepID=UPI000C17B02B|nr:MULTISPECIES: 4-amino-4-deoxy-L-arabinose-phosphoundecaprenol flippase subunit ArnF [unclassified Erwinia]PIJ50728.1 4-amino-4-deoxy-L-arabinose-phospho-UDP flippase [Erwinia sp. OAMSP11]PIJ75397.1 4-amino-4-deoxy-L-arabinose-phospho-UDP flippase [Erwinia sp. OLSSP12]PIJ81895.1 4-amino-4-deoxy-L-arabinose-phospho-UDP flippase [Erwinia sp. OLCASP19]PIJ84550.1 4-amino-4-deoxy-L-arabinose-phospho-UDP flippase [Erwinia sp. OLMTSP26]PIJ86897.1 4-amino-4-deoxy-L-arabinose-phospho-UDP flippase [Er